jgi:hypothetical protein
MIFGLSRYDTHFWLLASSSHDFLLSIPSTHTHLAFRELVGLFLGMVL